MSSKARLKYIKSLQLKKYRKEEQCFVVEGAKSVVELLTSDFDVRVILGTDEFLREHEALIGSTFCESATEAEMSSAGTLQSNHTAIAVARMKINQAPVAGTYDFLIAMDDIRDPGNAGTIIRTADWYGIHNIVASEETADFYNAKTISASMGSFCRVNVFYTDLKEYLKDKQNIYGAFLEGEDVHKTTFASRGVIVIGNESNGISESVGHLVHHKITIPKYGHAESLNAGISTAVILDNLRRSQK